MTEVIKLTLIVRIMARRIFRVQRVAIITGGAFADPACGVFTRIMFACALFASSSPFTLAIHTILTTNENAKLGFVAITLATNPL